MSAALEAVGLVAYALVSALTFLEVQEESRGLLGGYGIGGRLLISSVQGLLCAMWPALVVLVLIRSSLRSLRQRAPSEGGPDAS